MNTEARRKASAAFHAKREAEGLKKVTVWLSAEARFKLDALKKAAGSKDKAAEAAILSWAGPGAESAQAPPVAGKSALATRSKPRGAASKPKDTSGAKGTGPGKPPVPYGSRLKKR